MISQYDIIQAFHHAKSQGDKTIFILSDDEKSLLDSNDGTFVCSIETYAQYLREKLHCDFECIYYDHISLSTIYRCKQCGAIIFTGDDDRYDYNLKCPVCGDYKQHTDFWSKEDLDSDPEKQKKLQFYIECQDEMNAAYARRKKRNGLYDYQLFDKTWYTKKHSYTVELTRHCGHKNPLCGLACELRIGTKDSDCNYVIKNHINIPLSWYAFYIRCVYPYSKKCNVEFRKYLPWQKKPVIGDDHNEI